MAFGDARLIFAPFFAVMAVWTGAAQAQQPYYPPPQPQPYYPQQQQPYYPQQQQPYYPPPQPQPYYPQQPPPPPGYDPSQPRRQPEPEKKKIGWSLDNEMWGLRGTALSVGGGDHPTSTLGLGIGTIGLANGQSKYFSYRGESIGYLGGGSGGFEGALSGVITLGVGWLDEDSGSGPFIRGGVQGQIQGNDSFYLSAIRFPRGELGWHIGSSRGFLLEIGGSAAPMLDGRFDVGHHAHRRLGSSSSYGAYADLFLGPLAGTVEWIHTPAVSQPDTAINDVAGHVCLGTGTAKKERGFGLCFDGRHTVGDVVFGTPAQFSTGHSTYLGLTIGFGMSVSKAGNAPD